MDLLNYLISVTLLGIVIQFGQLWIVLGAAAILIVSSKSMKTSILLIISVAVLYGINGVGMGEYWLFAILGLVALGYLFGLGAEEKSADPYADLLGGGMGGMGM